MQQVSSVVYHNCYDEQTHLLAQTVNLHVATEAEEPSIAPRISTCTFTDSGVNTPRDRPPLTYEANSAKRLRDEAELTRPRQLPPIRSPAGLALIAACAQQDANSVKRPHEEAAITDLTRPRQLPPIRSPAGLALIAARA